MKQEQGDFCIILGVHRFVRVSPFDSNGKRHTSFVSVLTTPMTSKTDIESAKQIELKPNELEITTSTAQVAYF
jgi:peptide chain release factor 2